MTLSLRFGAVSDIGRIRKKNDDSGYAGPHLVVVADGMGGAPAGDVASAVTIQTVRRLDAPPTGYVLPILAGTIALANARLAEVVADDPSIEGMGTTLTAFLFDGERIGIAHLGDSRGYLLRDGELMPLTRDHSWVQSLIDEGRITEAEARVHSHRSLLLKVLDGRHDTEPDLSTHDVQAGDRLLVCSDGLSGFVPAKRIAQLAGIGTPQEAAVELTALALESGSTDNVTVLVAEVVEAPPTADPPLVVGAAGDQHRGPLARLRTWAQRDEPEPTEMLLVDPALDPEELRYAPRAPRRLLWLRRSLLAVVVLAIIAAGLGYAYHWSQTQYFVSASGNHVAIFRGLNAELPGISLNHVYEVQEITLDQLPEFRRSQVVAGLDADSLDRARRIVAELRGFAVICSGTPTRPAQLPPPPPPKTTPPPVTHPAHQQPGAIRPPRELVSPTSTSGGNPRECTSHGGSR